MNKTEKIKKIVMLVIMAVFSGYFMYSGFSIILNDTDENSTETQQQEKSND